LIVKVKGKLYESFTEYFQRDFDGAEPYLAEFEAMCDTPTRKKPAAQE